MDRCAILVDVGHLLAEGGKLCCGTKKRLGIECDYPSLIIMLVNYAEGHCDLPVLRTYWYDGARDGVPTADHLRIARLAGVKLRLGRLSGGRQKGVDALIYRDLMTLARERAIATAYLLGGDEDLREGVAAAQDMGVRVVVLGIETESKANQADTLVREADEHYVFQRDELQAFFSHVLASPVAAVNQRSRVLEPEIEKAARVFAQDWIADATHEELQNLIASYPVIPKELDVQLLQHVERSCGSLREREADRNLTRKGFWDTICSTDR
ncbi:MAG: NYN domain-containing protein [Egibacteraceae bacterium]